MAHYLIKGFPTPLLVLLFGRTINNRTSRRSVPLVPVPGTGTNCLRGTAALLECADPQGWTLVASSAPPDWLTYV